VRSRPSAGGDSRVVTHTTRVNLMRAASQAETRKTRERTKGTRDSHPTSGSFGTSSEPTANSRQLAASDGPFATASQFKQKLKPQAASNLRPGAEASGCPSGVV
jgi:hypothetical protein